MSKIRILIVEDELILAQDISNKLKDRDYEVLGVAPTVSQAIQLIEANDAIDLLLIDIMLRGDRDGIELAEIVNEKYKIPFIFLTAHADESLVQRAKNVRPYAYILKPFNEHQVSIAIELALVNFSKKTPDKNLLEHSGFKPDENQVLQIKDSLFLKKDHHFKRVPLKEILFIQADSNYSSVYTEKDRFVYSIVLKKIEEQLPHNKFLRTHRSYLVNVNSVDGFKGNTLFIGNNKIPVSKAHKSEVFKLFRTI